MDDMEMMIQTEVERRLNDPRFLQLKVSALLSELEIAQPKLESHDALMKSDTTMSIIDASKHFDLQPKKHVFPYLRSHRFLTQWDLPTREAEAMDILILREAHIPHSDMLKQQSMVEARQLERWRTYLVPRIRKWIEENQ
jgi:phage antirepressor YoqD-like protein